MVLDIICIATVFVWAVFGFRKGFVRQAFALAGVAGVVFLSVPMAEIIQDILSKDMGMVIASRVMRGFLLVVCGTVIYLFCYIVGRFVHNTLIKGISVAETTNHILGTSLGVIESTLGLYFILCLMSMVQDRIKEYAPSVHETMEASKCYALAAKNNFVENSGFFTKYRVTLPDEDDGGDGDSEDAPSDGAATVPENGAATAPENGAAAPEKGTTAAPVKGTKSGQFVPRT